ncbi:MAG TPA: Ig-like domain-containing protein, partial [Methylomirabilota bacterium]|nr:Ig-like domain-containing protein [Methylomirabilota bacterium]
MKDNLKPFRSIGMCILIAWLAGISARAANHAVEMRDFFFSPAVINVSVGDSVTWTVIEGNHDTTSGNPPTGATWESDLLFEGEHFTFQFTEAGSFPYVCAFHFGITDMTGAVHVASGPGMTPPTVNLTTPANNTVSNQTANLDLVATAADSDGTVVNVKFFLGANLVGLDDTAPYTASVRGLPPGSYSLTAVATDNDGLSRTSAPASVIVRHVVSYQPFSFTPNALTILPGETVLFTNRGGSHSVTGFGAEAFCGTPLVQFCNVTFNNPGFFPYRCRPHSSAVGGGFQGMTGAVTVANSVVRPPVIQVASPTNGQVFAGGSAVPVRTANVFDPDGRVLAVMFLVDGVPAGGDVEAPFEAELTGLASGTRVLTAVAMDNAGLSTTSAPVT